jgi:DNA-binding CsgD family transcriptional regulator/PAS domain-containing protein
MTLEAEFSKLIALVYDAALDGQRWPAAVGAIGAAMSDAGGILAVHAWTGGVEWAVMAGLDPASLQPYDDEFASSDSNAYLQVCRDVPLGEPISAETFAAPMPFEETDFYRNILAPQSLRHSVVLTLMRDEKGVAAVAFLRGAQAGPFLPRELDLLRALAPHLQRAMQLTLRIAELEARSSALAEVLSASPTSTLLTDAEARVIFLNPAASELLTQGDGVSLIGGRLEIHDPRARMVFTERLSRAVRAAASDGEVEWHDSEALVIPRPSGVEAYHVLVLPLCVAPGALPVDVPSTLVLINDPAASLHPPLEALAAIYGLTPMETALAALLVRRCTLKEATSHLGISINTVKTHLKQLFAKTRTRRQSELMRLVLQFPRRHRPRPQGSKRTRD